ncbi:MAG: hypothetical protein ACI4LJ_00555 [Anaerovoracaceae bacterium]
MADPAVLPGSFFRFALSQPFSSVGFPKLLKSFPKENKNGFLENQPIKNSIFSKIYKFYYSMKITILHRNWLNGEKIGENQRSVFQNRQKVFQKKTFRGEKKTEALAEYDCAGIMRKTSAHIDK